MLNISFNFDEETHKVSNLKVTDLLKNIEPIIELDCDLQVYPNKLQLSKEAVNKLQVSVGDRISINYWNESSTLTYPIISKADVFEDGSDGCLLKKSNTVSFRGSQNDTLLKFGKAFSFEEWTDKTGKVKEGVFKLIPVKEDDTADEDKIVEEIEHDIETTTSEEIEDDLSFLFE